MFVIKFSTQKMAENTKLKIVYILRMAIVKTQILFMSFMVHIGMEIQKYINLKILMRILVNLLGSCMKKLNERLIFVIHKVIPLFNVGSLSGKKELKQFVFYKKSLEIGITTRRTV